MARKSTDSALDHLKELQAQQSAAEESLRGHREREEALRKELDTKESELRMLDVELSERIETLIANIPPGDSSRLLGELEQFKQSGRADLNQAVTALGVALRAEAAQVRKAEAEVKKAAALIEQEHFDQAARDLHGELSDFVEKFKVLNGKRLRLFELARTCGFKDFVPRFQRLGLRYGISYGVLCDSHLATRNPDTMNVFQIAEQLESIGRAYDQKPVQLPGQPHGSDRIPMERDYFFNKEFVTHR